MSAGNGGNLSSRLDELEKMDKLLLRAQVLQHDALQTLQQTVARHEQSLAEQAKRDAIYDQKIVDLVKRDSELDERIDKLVIAIGRLIAKMGRRSRTQPGVN